MTAKILAAITTLCAGYIDHPGYVEEYRACGMGYYRNDCEIKKRPSFLNKDARYICEAVWKDCVKDKGFKQCKTKKWGHGWSTKNIVDTIISTEHYAPTDVLKNHKRENNYYWRNK